MANVIGCYLLFGGSERARSIAPIASMVAIVAAAVADRSSRARDTFGLTSALALCVAFDATVLIAMTADI